MFNEGLTVFRLALRRLSGLRGPALRRGLAALVGAEIVVVAAIYAVERVSLHASRNDVTYDARNVGPYFRKHAVKGLQDPPVVPRADARLDPNEEVVGVEFGGTARAYRLGALRDREHHVINDVVGGVPVSVAFCDASNCVRVYTDPDGHTPLDVETAGRVGREMVIKVGSVLYWHSTGEPMTPGAGQTALPYRSPEPERMTWAEWARRHPETDVFIDARKGPSQ